MSNKDDKGDEYRKMVNGKWYVFCPVNKGGLCEPCTVCDLWDTPTCGGSACYPYEREDGKIGYWTLETPDQCHPIANCRECGDSMAGYIPSHGLCPGCLKSQPEEWLSTCVCKYENGKLVEPCLRHYEAFKEFFNEPSICIECGLLKDYEGEPKQKLRELRNQIDKAIQEVMNETK